jgi:hypothetical protein
VLNFYFRQMLSDPTSHVHTPGRGCGSGRGRRVEPGSRLALGFSRLWEVVQVGSEGVCLGGRSLQDIQMEDRAGAREMTWLSATQTQAQSHTTFALVVVKARRIERGASVVVIVVIVVVVVVVVVVVRRSGVIVVIGGRGICVEGSRVVIVAVVVVSE